MPRRARGTRVIGNKIFLTRHSPGTHESTWSDEDGSTFSISEDLPEVSPDTPLSSSTSFPLVYDAGDAHAVWKIGNAYLKVAKIFDALETREHITLNAMNAQNLSFKIPSVLFHGEWDQRYYLVTSEVPGQTLHKAWRIMDEDARQACVCRVVEICKELAQLKGDAITGIGGGLYTDHYMSTDSKPNKDFPPEVLLQNCKDMGMDCSRGEFSLFHADLAPGNVLIEFPSGAVNIIDWETVGYVPKEWIVVKFRMSGGLDFNPGEGASETYEWRQRVSQRLRQEGFPDASDGWLAWRAKRGK
jgi:serine/threonine protein kinase